MTDVLVPAVSTVGALVGALVGATAPHLMRARSERLAMRRDWVAEVLKAHIDYSFELVFDPDSDAAKSARYPKPEPSKHLVVTDALRPQVAYRYWIECLRIYGLSARTSGPTPYYRQALRFDATIIGWANGRVPTLLLRLWLAHYPQRIRKRMEGA